MSCLRIGQWRTACPVWGQAGGTLAAKLPFVQFVGMKMLRLGCFVVVSLTGCGTEPRCSSEKLQVARDLGSDRYAVTSARNCGATADYTTTVHVGRASEPQSARAEVFIADGDHGAAIRNFEGAIWTNVVWTAPGNLSIAYASKARIFKRVRHAKGAAITFKPGDPVLLPPIP